VRSWRRAGGAAGRSLAAQRFGVELSPEAAGTAVGDLPLPENAWISFILRRGHLVPVQADMVLEAGDEVIVLATEANLRGVFTEPHHDDPWADQPAL
jgi:Trk K+ transport system NAD-binding subunit